MFPIIDNKNVYHGESLFSDKMAKQCALIEATSLVNHCGMDWYSYWKDVKVELEKL